MFSKEIYISRRAALRQKVGSGLILLPGNQEPVEGPFDRLRDRGGRVRNV